MFILDVHTVRGTTVKSQRIKEKSVEVMGSEKKTRGLSEGSEDNLHTWWEGWSVERKDGKAGIVSLPYPRRKTYPTWKGLLHELSVRFGNT